MPYESKIIKLALLRSYLALGWHIAPTMTCGDGFVEVRRAVVQERA